SGAVAGRRAFEPRPRASRRVAGAGGGGAPPAAGSKGVAVERPSMGTLPPVSGDASRLQQVVGNLLANAIKFTPGGGRIEVSVERAGSVARVSVRDTGQGISADFLPFIFERFRQADTPSTP